MNLYRCAACGSTRVMPDSKKEGYDIKKGVAGTVLFGAAGAVMGVNGNEKTYYHCMECGQTLSYTMSESTKKMIDSYLLNPDEYKEMIEMQKKIYPNIEDRDIRNIQIDKKEKFNSNEELADAIWEYYNKTKIPYIADDMLKEGVLGKDCYRKIEYPVSIYNAMDILIEKGLATLEVKGKSGDRKIYYTFYSNAEDIKRNLNNLIVEKEYKKIFDTNREELINIFLKLIEENRKIICNQAVERLSDILKEKGYSKDDLVIEKLSIGTIKSAKKLDLIGFEEKENFEQSVIIFLSEEIYLKKQKDKEQENNEIEKKILESLKNGSKKTIEEIQDSNESLKEISNQRILRCLIKFKDDGLVIKEAINNQTYFSLTKIHENVKEKNREQELKDIEENVLESLKGSYRKTIPDIQNSNEKLKDVSYQMISMRLRLLMERGLVIRKIIDKTSYFSLPETYKKLKEKEEKEIEGINKKNEEFNSNLNLKINKLIQEKEMLLKIVAENRFKLFGAGAKMRREAEEKIVEIDIAVFKLKNQLKK